MPDVQQPINQPTIPQYYNPSGPAAQIQATMPQVQIHHNQQPPPHVLSTQPVATVNGALHPEDINVISGMEFIPLFFVLFLRWYIVGPVPTHVPSGQNQPGLTNALPNLQQGLVQAPLNPPTPIEDQPSQVIEEPVEEQLENSFVDQQELEQEQSIPIETGR